MTFDGSTYTANGFAFFADSLTLRRAKLSRPRYPGLFATGGADVVVGNCTGAVEPGNCVTGAFGTGFPTGSWRQQPCQTSTFDFFHGLAEVGERCMDHVVP